MNDGLFSPNDADRALARSLFVAAIVGSISPATLEAGLGLADADEIAAWELRPFADAIETLRSAWGRVSEPTRKRLIDGRLRRRIATATGFVDGVEVR